MSPATKEKFLEWHNSLKDNDYVFNFQEEILAYCRSDVDILRRCCLEFRELFCDITEIDPFEKCLTIALACNQVYLTNYLQENTIAIIPLRGYCPENKQSLKMVVVYGRTKRDLHTTCSQRRRETCWSVFARWVS